ncbi:MAG: hypothetical protein ACOCW3_02435 [Spirochaetota bacterium]
MRTSTIVSILLLALAVIAPVAADSQVDIGVNIPGRIRLSVDDESVTEQIPFRIPVPDLMYNYYTDVGPIKLGGGARVWTLILLTGAYPIVSAEFETERFILNAHLGGLVFGYLTPFPEWSGIETGRVFLPEISAAFRLTDWFSLGVAALSVRVPEVTDGSGHLINVFGRFRVR